MTPKPRQGRPPLPGPKNLRVYIRRRRLVERGPMVLEGPLPWVCPNIKAAILGEMKFTEFWLAIRWGKQRVSKLFSEDCPGITETELYQVASALGCSVDRLRKKAPLS